MAAAHGLRIVAGCALLFAAVLGWAGGWGPVHWWQPVLLAAVVAVSETAVVQLQFGRQRWTLSLTEGALGAAWVFATGAWSVAAVVLGVVIAQLVRRQSRLKVGFNAAQFAAAAAAGSTVAQLIGPGIPAAAAGIVVFWAFNITLVAYAVATLGDRPVLPLLVDSVPQWAAHSAGNASIGLLAAFLAREEPLGLLGLVIPLGLLWASYDQQTQRSAEAGLFAELACGQPQAAGRSTDSAAQAVVLAAVRLLGGGDVLGAAGLFGGAEVDLVLMAADGPVHYAGDNQGGATRRRVDPSAFDAPWVLRRLGTTGVDKGLTDGRPWCSAVLGQPAAPLGVLRARRAVGAAGFTRRDMHLAQILVGQAESWLTVADLALRHARAAQETNLSGGSAQALGNLGAATAPALTILRESADRLSRLAESSGGVEEIVDELQLVEQAVASLLGAIALAAVPDLRRVGSTARQARPLVDWTTTGVLP